jgi:putative DNA primase/helicase
MNVEALLARLQGVRKNGKGWQALCPAHADKNPSLSISVGGDGKILVHCHAGCSQESVFSAMKVEPRELSQQNGDGGSKKVKPKIVATYDYKDERGTLLYQKVRYEPKAFRQRRPDGNGGWTWKLDGVRRVLYRLSEVLAEESIIVC